MNRRYNDPSPTRRTRLIYTHTIDRFSNEDRLEPPSSEETVLINALREALETGLLPRQREIVKAHFFEGLSQSEIARNLGVSQQVVQKAIFGDVRKGKRVGGALLRLRHLLKNHKDLPTAHEPDGVYTNALSTHGN
ncbi:MAG: hypothetical protein IPK82_25930 [Polyangiaceae bacterium]|nr:hypothetical protein [Polyangiaceae bacterium]